MGPGILLALIAALFSSLKGIARKHVSRDFSSVEIGLMGQVYGAILLMPFAAYRYLEAEIALTPGIILALAISTSVVIAGSYLYIEALRIADISVTEPLRNTSPIFVAVLEPILLNMNFEVTILAAALFGSLGAYILLAKESLLKPIENMKNRGALLSVLVAFLLSIFSIAQRFGATNMDPLLFIYATYLTGLAGFWIWKKNESGSLQPSDYLRKDVMAMGTVTAAGVVAGIYAYSLISASEVSIVKQTSIIFGVLIGGRFFREEDLARKLVGGLIIILGILLLIL